MVESDTTLLTDQAWTLVEARRYKDANALFARLCGLTPDDAEAWLMRGVTQVEMGDPSSARTFLLHAATLDPGYADPCLHLGKLALAEGDAASAIRYAEQATQLDVAYVEAWLLAAASHGYALQHEAAARCARQAMQLDPANPQALAMLAQALHGLGGQQMAQRAYDAADLAYQELLGINPGDQCALNALGNICLARGSYKQAEAYYRQAIALSPDAAPEALSNLGQVLQTQGHIPEAIACYEQALETVPNNSRFHLLLAMGLQAYGQFERAIEHCDRALHHEPGLNAALVGKADILQKQGKYMESHRLLQSLIESGQAPASAVLVFADACVHLKQGEHALVLLENLLTQPELSLREQQQTHAALGSLYDKQGRYDQAFTNFRQSNQIKLKEGGFDSAGHEKYIDRLIATYNADFMASAMQGSSSELPVFIVGMPRSGTSLVEQILASHPAVYGAGELDLIQRLSTGMRGRLGGTASYPACMGLANSAHLAGAANEYLQYLSSLDADALRITDKMPHNFLHLGLIQCLFPRARIIHVSRDPLDTCLSCYFQNFSTTHSYAYDLEKLGAYYLQYEKLMRHWNQVLRLPILHVQYESLVENQEAVSRQMIAFCGLEWDEQALRFYETQRNVATPSYDQVRQPMYRKSVQRWKNYATHLGSLHAALNRV